MPNCVTSCGDVEVPYPFGIGTDASCYMPGFNLTCNNTDSRPRLLLDADGTLQVLAIYVDTPLLFAHRNGDVKVEFGGDGNGNGTFSHGLRRDGPYMLYSESELILTGCNVQATVKSGNVTVASCTSLCRISDNDDKGPPTADDERNGPERYCSGGSTGCCRADVFTAAGYYDDGEVYNSTSTGTSKYDVELRWVGWNRSADLERLPVRVFIAHNDWFDNSSVYDDLL